MNLRILYLSGIIELTNIVLKNRESRFVTGTYAFINKIFLHVDSERSQGNPPGAVWLHVYYSMYVHVACTYT